MRIGHLLSWSLAVFQAAIACAAAGDPIVAGAANRRFTLQGFGTLGIARSDNDRLQYVRDRSQPDGVTDNWSGKIEPVFGRQADSRMRIVLDLER